MFYALLRTLQAVLEFYSYLIVAAAIVSWLVAFSVINVRNQFVRMIVDFLYRLTEPVLRPIRRFLPNLGGIDISPVVVLFVILFLSRWIDQLLMGQGFF